MISQIDIDYDSPCRLRQEYGQKINEVIDAVNKLEQVIKTLIDGLERFAKSQQEVNMEITAIITKGGDNE